MKAKYLWIGCVVTSLVLASCNDKKSAEVDTVATVSAKPETKLAKELIGKAHLMVGGEYQETQVKNADYYLVYFTASWWGPCRASIPKLVGIYNDKIAKNDKVEFILVSEDETEADAKKWSKEGNFPWPQILPDVDKEGVSFMKHKGELFPLYLLVDKDGNKVAEGLEDAMEKINSL